MAAAPDASVDALQAELVAWDGQYTSSGAAAGPAKWRLRQEFLAGPYASLLRGLQERGAAAERARAAEADRRMREVREFALILTDGRRGLLVCSVRARPRQTAACARCARRASTLFGLERAPDVLLLGRSRVEPCQEVGTLLCKLQRLSPLRAR